MTATSKSSAAAAATAGALAAATVALCYSPFCNFLSHVFPKESWGPGVGVELATAYMYPIIIASLLYLPLTYGLRRYMQNRPPYSLKGVAFLWNLSLSLLSLLGFLTVLIQQPRMLLVSMHPERYFSPPVRVVITIFTLTKAVEFGDTLLLVLKKKPLSFLHLYHHLTVSLYCWHAQYINADFAHGFAIMNLAVHAVMYFYFCLTCVLTPTRGSITASKKGCCTSTTPTTRLTAIQRMLYKSRPLITMMQIAQMLVGMYLSYQGIYLKDRMQVFNAQLALAMYTSYAILFLHLYCSSYLPHLSSNRVLLLLLLHMVAGLGVYKLWQESQHKLLLTLQMGVVAAVSLSLSFYSSSTNSKSTSKTRALSNSSRVLLPLTLTFNWLSGIAHAMREGETAEERERTATKQQTPTETSRETKEQGDSHAPSRCLSGTSTTAETATLSSCISSTDCMDDDTHTTPTVPGTAAAAAACCAATGLAAAHAAQTAAETGDIHPPSPKKRDRKEEGNNKTKGLIYQLVKKERNFSFKWTEVAAAAAGAAAPAVYGHITNGDWGLGFCFFGALRWAIELHAADQIASYA